MQTRLLANQSARTILVILWIYSLVVSWGNYDFIQLMWDKKY